MIKKDALVVGAGPSGATAAKELSKKGLDTLLIEKRQEIGTPVRCAEGVGKTVEEYVDLDKEVISKDVVGAKIYSPDEEFFEMTEEVAGNEVGYILDRKKFDRHLVEKAIEEGANVQLRTRASDVERKDDEVITQVHRNGEKYKIKSDVLIAADGVESRIGRLTGVTNSLNPDDVVSCAQYLVTNLNEIDLDYTYFYLGRKVAPGGYAWIFPKGENRANVGLGIQPTIAKKRAREYLDEFMEIIGADNRDVLEEMFGAVPVTQPLETAVDDKILLVGDAARQADPITGGGIINGIKAGKFAAEAVKEAFDLNDFSKKNLDSYEEKRKNQIAERNQRNYELKELFQKLGDESYNSIISSLKGEDFEKLSVGSIVTKLVDGNPEIAKEIKEII